MEEQPKKKSKEEIKREKFRCWTPNCKNRAIFEDRGGWRWCWKHYWWNRDGYFSKIRKIIW